VLTVTASKLIPVPPADAWALACDTGRYAEYVKGTAEVSRSGGPARDGVTYEEVNPILGPWKARTTWTVIAFDPPRRQVHRSTDVPLTSRFDVTMEVAPEGEGSRVTFTLDGTPSPGPLGAAFARVMRAKVDRDNRESLEGFAELLLSGRPGRPATAAPAA
jgi:carbon monoxide dehydrogenase subunit G